VIAFIDMDIVAYRCAASCEPTKTKLEREPIELAIQRTDELMYRILLETDCEEYQGWLSGSENFRKLIYPEYKANRDNIRRPEYLQPVRAFLVEEWKAKLALGYEADDAIGINFTDAGILCSIDKDFKQIPGRHYNFVTMEFDDVSPLQAEQNFWTSMLIGDRVDNIQGIPGIGKAKAPRILEGLSPSEMKEKVFELYEQFDMDFHMTYNLLRILRDEEEFFNINENIKRQSERARATADSSRSDLSETPPAK
jgi:5'-3' exonuclease